MMWRAALAAGAMLLSATGASSASPVDTGAVATFRAITYVAHNPLDETQPLNAGEYRNPIIPGFHPDPSIVRVGGDYYLVNSSFGYYPGLPIFHSRDLVHWTQIGNAIDRPDMFSFQGLGIARAVFAPTLRFHDGVFYIINTCEECGGNFIITTKNVAGPWSKPIFLPSIDGIDTDLFFDDDGRVWVANNGPPVGTPRYDGHRALWIQELDLATMQMVGPRSVIVDGGVHPADKPIWTEGPHIFKKDGFYYLIAAEGGTAGEHSETVYRAPKVTGPYTPGQINPILTQRDLDPARPNPVYATGHADFVQTQNKEWWAVFLGTRPYRANLSSMGRETFMLPVTWRNGWPLILPAKTVLPQTLPGPRLSPALRQPAFMRASALAPDWLMLRTPNARWYHTTRADQLIMTAGTESLSGRGNPAFLAKRQTERSETVSVSLAYVPSRVGDHAGLAAFADEEHFYTFGVWQTAQGRALIVTVRNGHDDPPEGKPIASVPLDAITSRLRLRLKINDPDYGFDYALADNQWRTLIAQADSTPLASERSNQFTGVVIGPYAARGLAQ